MNSRQRRGVILLLLSVLCAVGAFAGVLSVVNDVESKVGPETTAYKLTSDVQPYKALDAGEFEKVSMPKRYVPSTAVTDLDELRGKIAVTQLTKGSLLQRDMIANRPALKPGQQEIAIMIDAATGVAGKITPGAKVNIYATFEGTSQGEEAVSKLIVAGAEVLDLGKITALEPNQDDKRRIDEAVPITFALNTKNAQRVAYAESFASHVRLALVAPGGGTSIGPGDRTYTLDGDK
ncbi:Flp pilus assembly protein CpaB [Streptomyces sp. PSAA01]|uniref:Flp pilus assembly protein CpaB n=1 Tax=Streptomyces sp. PSAA01 TaxID=2912762 RepID=UPI001F38E9FE|nr:Flp pilus assembly protein CpaB [Streptomyces sp. PSAA01]MCG0286951.1 Flp pilus assembly protein CpaB [Streptomyces sp. PSAA01]